MLSLCLPSGWRVHACVQCMCMGCKQSHALPPGTCMRPGTNVPGSRPALAPTHALTVPHLYRAVAMQDFWYPCEHGVTLDEWLDISTQWALEKEIARKVRARGVTAMSSRVPSRGL